MSAATVSRGSRLFVLVAAGWFVCWQVAVALGGGRRLGVVLGLYGFVFHTVFGKAYALVPTYFDRALAFPRAPSVHLPLAVGGTAFLALDAAGVASVALPAAGRLSTLEVGAVGWALGIGVFAGALGWSVRDNLSGAETATSEAKADRRRVDRFANGFVPLALAYLLGSAVLLATGGAGPFGRTAPQLSHLLAVGTATLLLFALGFRLLPRFLVVRPRLPLVLVVLPAGALGPLLLVVDFAGSSPWFLLGAALQAIALVGFAVAYADMWVRSDRRRVGLTAVLVAAMTGGIVALLGVHMATAGLAADVAAAHVRLGLLGFLGVAIVGVSYQFYPPGVATVPLVGDRSAAMAVALLVCGVAAEAAGLLGAVDPLVEVGRLLALAGAILHAVNLVAVFVERRR